MNNGFWGFIAAVAVLAGVVAGTFLIPHGATMSGPTAVPKLYKTDTLSTIWNAYRKDTYITDAQQAKVVSLTGWKATFGTKALVLQGRYLYNGQVITYRTWQVIAPIPASHPFLLEFDKEGNGILTKSDGLVCIGDPLTTAPIPEAVYLASAQVQTAPSPAK